MEQLLEDIDLGEKQEQLLAREFSREYHLITRDERLEKIAEDIVAHFMGRGQMGKAMVVSIDKATAIRMYDNVHKYWQRYLEDLQAQFRVEKDWDKREPLSKDINYMKSTDMAVVVSQAQNEVEEFQKKGLDIKPHRLRMVREDLEKAFKDENNPLRIVFVCAMWMTGFDVPSLSTIYLDKPMRNHTLMQTIARANRVFGDKNNGLIVDYVGIFRNLEKALAIYASTREDGEGDFPVKDKHELVLTLQQAITAASTFCTARGIDLDTILATPFKSFEHIRELESAKDKLVINDETEKHYLALAADIARLYKAILPDAAANTYTAIVAVCIELARIIHDAKEPEDISELMEDVEDLMDTSVITKNYVIRELTGPYNTQRRIDLSQIDFDALKAQFAQAHKYSEAGQLRGLINSKLKKMVRLNKNRLNYQEKFQRLIDEYNGGSFNVEVYYDKLIAFAQELKMEDQRTIAEQLTEEELTVFDLLTRPNITLSDKEKESVKMVACSLLATLKQEKLVLDWRKKQEARAQVQQAVEQALDSLPDVYNQEIYLQKCIDVYQHVYDSYYGEGKSIYADAS